MATITVSTQTLRETARVLRNLIDERRAAHRQLWLQTLQTARSLPRDVHAAHAIANNPWLHAVEAQYSNYYALAQAMEDAADLYEHNEINTQISFTPSN